jgi:hypothetical protein
MIVERGSEFFQILVGEASSDSAHALKLFHVFVA